MPVATMLPEFPADRPSVTRRAEKRRGKGSAVAFTKALVAKMHCPQGKCEALWWDASCRGLGLRALASGRRSWVYQYRDADGRTRRLALGDVTAVNLDVARELVRQHTAKVTLGTDPKSEKDKKRQGATVTEVVEEYLEYAERKQRPRTFRETDRHLRKHLAPLHHERINSVDKDMLGAFLHKAAKKHGPIAANRVRSAISAMWFWGLRTGRIAGINNPAVFTIRQPKSPERKRAMTDVELKAIWAATEGAGTYERVVRLCLLTGCRRQEIGGLRWSEVGNELITIDAERMKNHDKHEVPLLPAIAACLPVRPADATGPVFGRVPYNSFGDGKERLDARLKAAGHDLPQWGLHDLRRTVSTRLNEADVEPHVVEAILAHKVGGVAGIYNHAKYRPQKRAALTVWHEMLAEIVA